MDSIQNSIKKIIFERSCMTLQEKLDLWVKITGVNADCVGAYNILRLYLHTIKKDYPVYKMLSNPLKVAV